MTESYTPRILILEADEPAREKARQVLEGQGWEVTCETVSKDALDRLKQSKASPFHLFISSFKLPAMEGDDILTHAKSISPLTQRMLMAPPEQTDMVIRAINKAEINGCIITPAADQDLVDQARSCLKQFDREMKQKRLKRLIPHQNKQMFIIAQRLKKKDKLSKEKINTLKAEKIRLSSILANALSQKKDPATLADRIHAHEIPLTPQALDGEFQKLGSFTQTLFNNIAAKENLAQVNSDINEIITRTAPETSEENAPLIQKILRTVFSSPETPALEIPAVDEEENGEEQHRDNFITLRISKDKIRALVKKNVDTASPDLFTLDDLLEFLREKEISFGIIDDQDIESWIAKATPTDDEFQIAKGVAPITGQDGSVEYFFETEYTNPGKIMENGRIDFRDRGEIPFVNKGELLATLTPPRQGKNGMSISGEPIEVDDPLDPVFLAGTGTKISEDGLNIHADIDGQPHLDHLGEISVNPELPISGDVDFETGNIEFNGNILVQGTVKEGFTVKGVSLTAKEIEGAIINLTGDLNVSDGITDADIVSAGNIHAKFINNSKINAFGNAVIQKEIIDSTVLLSGQCENPTGVIIASKITAKEGVEAGKIGTEASEPAHLRVGVDDHIKNRLAQIEASLEKSLDQLQEIREKVYLVENEDQALYGQITEKAQVQESLQNQITGLKKQLTELKEKENQTAVDQTLDDLKKLTISHEKANQALNHIFEIQDSYAKKIEAYKRKIERIETANKTLVLKKKGLREFEKKSNGVPRVNVQKKITQETKVTGPNTSLTVREDRGRCQILEHTIDEDGLRLYEMRISDL